MSRICCRNSQSFYSYILKCCFILFLCSNVALFYYMYEKNDPMCQKKGPCRTNKRSRKLAKTKWDQTLYFQELKNFKRIEDEWRLKSPFSADDTELNCSSMYRIQDMEFIAAGWTKSAYKVRVDGKIVSMKIINVEGHDMSLCMLEDDKKRFDCYLAAASKLLREITLLKKLSHPNVIKILGYCIPVEPSVDNWHNTIAIFQEYGVPINVIRLLQLTWEDRLRICLGLSRLLKHLASFKDPIALHDFRRQQFVVIEGELKLIDVDDVGLAEPKCNNTPCCLSVPTDSNKMICLPCIRNTCQGYNEKMNILKTGSYFIQHILPHGAPSNLNAMALKITLEFELASMNTSDILKEMENLVTSFKNGWYRKGSTTFLSGYKVYSQKDLSSDFDYRCKFTAFSYGCMMSVSSSEEAADVCMRDLECKAFVITNITTWTGRRIILFKNGIGSFIDNNATTLYVKQ